MIVRHLKTAVSAMLGYAAQAYSRVHRNYSATARRLLGVGFVFGGFLAVLPVFGIWMLPVGLALLSDDVPALRNARRRVHAKLLAWAKDRQGRPSILRRRRMNQAHSGGVHGGQPNPKAD